MRYNSLRSQLNWHSRQQTHLFKKLAKTPIEKDGPPIGEGNALEEETQLKGQELIWLEKMMKELHQYKEDATEGKQKPPRQAESADAVIKEKCTNGNKPIYMVSEKHQKVGAGQDQNGKSAKKIRFQILMNSQKPQSAKKKILSQPKSKPKSVKKQPSKVGPKKSLPQKQTSNKEGFSSVKDITICCPSNTKLIEMETIKTDPYSFKETDIKILEDLWKKQSETHERSEEKIVLSTKKSVGKIIRNSDKLNKTCLELPQKPEKSITPKESSVDNQLSSYKQYKQSRYKQSISINSFESRENCSQESRQLKPTDSKQVKKVDISPREKKQFQKTASDSLAPKKKTKYEKIFIKLETQKLSEYLSQKSQTKPTEAKENIIATNQYEKYCPNSTRINQSTTSASVALPNSESKYLSTQNPNRLVVENTSKKQQPAPRAKSQQRKFNKCAQSIKKTDQFQFTQKWNQNLKPKEDSYLLQTVKVQSRIEQVGNPPQLKLKRRYDYKEESIPNKAQKLFTLHSVSSERTEKDVQQEFMPSLRSSDIQRPTFSHVFEEPPFDTSPNPPPSQPSIVICEQSSQQFAQSNIRSNSYASEESSTDPTHQLTLLFNFLDQGQRGLLTDTNCQYESLTEDLKLLFSAILNQIRTKKRFYNLQKFIEESKQILQIKKEVYINNHSKSPQDRGRVYHSLKQNVEVLRKKFPLMFVKHTFTQSCNDNNSNTHSKKNSVSYGQSFVIDRVEIEKPKKQFEDKILHEKQPQGPNVFSSQGKQLNGPIDIKWAEKSKQNKENSQQLQFVRKLSRRAEEHHADIDLLQPEIYLQKKYGFNKTQEQGSGHSVEKVSTILQKTRGYLQNLDSYLKLR